MKKIKITESQLKKLVVNEQLLKNLGDKIKTGVQNVVNKVTKASPDAAAPQKQSGRNLDQLKAEWSKINQDMNNMTGFGEAVGPNLNAVMTQAQMAARVVILRKMKTQQATISSYVVDEATFQLDNGNYHYMVLIKLDNRQMNEEVSRIKQVMGIHENEEAPIPPDVMKAIEQDADGIIAQWEKKREESLHMIQKLEAAMNDPKNRDNEVVLRVLKQHQDDLKNSLPTESTPEHREKLIQQLIQNHRRDEALSNYYKERAENAKTAQITKDQIIDVFVTAIEGGSNYWYYILDVPKDIEYMTKQEDLAFSEACGKHVLDGGELTIYDAEEVAEMDDPDNDYADDKPEPLGTINMDSLLDAISIMKKDYPERYEAIVMDEYDAEDADVFFQIATMGEIVFG